MEKEQIIERFFSENSLSRKTKESLMLKFEKALESEKMSNIPYYVAEIFFRRILSSNDTKDKHQQKYRGLKLINCF